MSAVVLYENIGDRFFVAYRPVKQKEKKKRRKIVVRLPINSYLCIANNANDKNNGFTITMKLRFFNFV